LLPLVILTTGAADDAPAGQTAQTEVLGVDIPDEFTLGKQTRNNDMQMLEIVDPPETIDNWTKLVTLQVLFGSAVRSSNENFYSGWLDAFRLSCPGPTEVVKGTVDGKAAIRATLSCKNNPETGKPENLEAFLVRGDVNVMVVRVAFRHPLAAEDSALIERIAQSLKVCDQRTLSACSERKATGFLPSAGRMTGR
jgi:hypothetical protein